jgi:putative DNA primase/helicase
LKRFLLPFHKEKTLDEIVALFEANPDGIANKYVGRIREEVERAYEKIDVHLDSLPVVVIAKGQIPRMLSESANALKKQGVPLYARGGFVVMPRTEEFDAADDRKTGATVLSRQDVHSLRCEMAHVAMFVEYKLIEGVPTPEYTDPPAQIANMMLSPTQRFTVPTISGVTAVPLIHEDGTVFGGDKEAYDKRSGMYYVPTVTLPVLAAKPTKEEAREALELLKLLLNEFPFVSDLDRSVALAGMFTATVRCSIPTAPMVLIRAHSAGTGKSYLVDLFSMLVTGDIAPVITVPTNPEELEKRLGAMILSGVPIIALDNATWDLAGDLLCQVTERARMRVRILGKSETPEFDIRTAVYATGNNVGVASDMTRRTLFCNLDAKVERPEECIFNGNPVAQVKAARGDYIGAIFTIIRAYLAAGAPGVVPLASYATWSKMVRGPLMWLGEPDPVKSMEEARDEDPVRRRIAEFFDSELMALDARYTTKQIAEMATGRNDEVEDTLKPVGGENGVINNVALGLWLKSITGRIVNGRQLLKDSTDKQRPRWVLVKA